MRPDVGVLAVHMRGISKRFGAVAANADVELKVSTGSVHGIVGENGAGKSTLMSILYGFYEADAGTIDVFGRTAKITNADEAIAVGIGMVHQHFMLVDTLSGIENVMLGAEPHWSLQRALPAVREKLNRLMKDTGLVLDLDKKVADLPVGDQQRLEILKTLYRGARILILDEPTAVLTPQETEHLFVVLRKLRQDGCTIILITHKLKEVMRLCDHVTVMRAGRVVQEMPIAQASIESLAEAMVGRRVHLGRVESGHSDTGVLALDATDLSYTDRFGVKRLEGVSLRLMRGEIVGVAGVSGNGQSELLDVLSGMLRPDRGRMELGDRVFSAEAVWLDPKTARHLGVGHVPEDRHARALILGFEAWESSVLGFEDLAEFSAPMGMRHANMRSACARMMETFDVRPRDPNLVSSKFSGGNQQKFVLARELGQTPKVLLVGQPTRGVDIGAIEFIYAQLRAMRDAGCAVLVVSSELDEILALSDRVVVMNQGRVSGILPIEACTEAELGLLMIGGGAS
ncbi:ABC transporter ATP-binding protein [Curvibacter sp. APW13]|uniref:ABC transporter ATP-binding protein n=1 Tax=Curvibacter sp. APW13 TaxID=3077236 RepID=UPI0028DE7071|nr:ABC transporter ATP-binding protein [Curvibacter sp. APW13]MDT8991651.1 ABC transporter ATP-binding protein [Curvibacter sp. APW13]